MAIYLIYLFKNSLIARYFSINYILKIEKSNKLISKIAKNIVKKVSNFFSDLISLYNKNQSLLTIIFIGFTSLYSNHLFLLFL